MKNIAKMPEIITNHVNTNVGKYRKDQHFTTQYSIIVPCADNFAREILSLRIYLTQSRAYACMWINDRYNGLHISGGGYAGGYGYHRPSAAAECAIASCGIKLNKAIGGVGDSAIKEALHAIACAMGYPTHYLHEAHA